MKTYIALILWIILTLLLITLFTELLSAISTFRNIIGLVVGVFWIIVSYETNCFTNIKFKKK